MPPLEVRVCDALEDGSELDSVVLADRLREALLRARPERTPACDEGAPGGSQIGDSAPSVLVGHVQSHEAPFLEGAQEVAERRTIHHKQAREVPDRTRTGVIELSQDGVLVRA